MKRLIITVMFAVCAVSASAQATDTAKVLQLVKLMNGENAGLQILKLMEGEIRKSAPGLDSMFFVELYELADFNTMLKLQVPLYCKYYTNEEIEQLIKFYKTPVGKKTIGILPEITVEAMTTGQQWARDLMAVLAARYQRRMKERPKVDVEVRDDGTETPIPPAPPPPAKRDK